MGNYSIQWHCGIQSGWVMPGEWDRPPPSHGMAWQGWKSPPRFGHSLYRSGKKGEVTGIPIMAGSMVLGGHGGGWYSIKVAGRQGWLSFPPRVWWRCARGIELSLLSQNGSIVLPSQSWYTACSSTPPTHTHGRRTHRSPPSSRLMQQQKVNVRRSCGVQVPVSTSTRTTTQNPPPYPLIPLSSSLGLTTGMSLGWSLGIVIGLAIGLGLGWLAAGFACPTIIGRWGWQAVIGLSINNNNFWLMGGSVHWGLLYQSLPSGLWEFTTYLNGIQFGITSSHEPSHHSTGIN